jgi:hypothetical protein
MQTMRTFRNVGLKVIFGTNLIPAAAAAGAQPRVIRVGDVVTVNKQVFVP